MISLTDSTQNLCQNDRAVIHVYTLPVCADSDPERLAHSVQFAF